MKIAEHNKLYEKGLITHTLEINQFGDLVIILVPNFFG